jgi:hypothetical protein
MLNASFVGHDPEQKKLPVDEEIELRTHAVYDAQQLEVGFSGDRHLT